MQNDSTLHDQQDRRGILDRAREGLGDMERRLRRKMRLHPKGNTPATEPGVDASREQPVGAHDEAA